MADEIPDLLAHLRAMGFVEVVLTDEAGYVPVLSGKGMDMVWGWHNWAWVSAA